MIAVAFALGAVIGYAIGLERAARLRRSDEAMRHVSRRY